jgi:microcystin-dependent protein
MANGILVPVGKQQFFDNNGDPLSAGTVDFYIPATTTRKNTWSDSACTILNANPVVLDAAGRASIYGQGDYRQVVKNSSGATIFDQIVSGINPPETAADVLIDPIAEFPDITNVQDFLEAIVAYFVPVGQINPWMGPSAPSGFLLCNGAAVSRTTYARLFKVLVTDWGFTATAFTVTIATPAVVTKIGHGLIGGERLRLTTTGALPTGLSTSADYFVEYIDANTFYLLSAARGGARINTSGTQSGVHSYTQSICGLGDGSTTFNVPELRREFVRGPSAGEFLIGGKYANTVGPHTHPNATTSSDGNHNHSFKVEFADGDGGAANRVKDVSTSGSGTSTDTTNSGNHTHTVAIAANTGTTESRPDFTVANWIIKF